MYSQANTNNPLGQRPLNLLATLNGMGDAVAQSGPQVPAGTILTYKGVWPVTLLLLSGDIINKVAQRLAADGLPVRTQTNDQSIIGALGSQPFGVTLQIESLGSYARLQDVISIIRHEVYEVTGQFPQSDSMVSVQLPGSQQTLYTNQPGTAPGGTDWNSWVQDNAGILGVGAAAIFFGFLIVRK